MGRKNETYVIYDEFHWRHRDHLEIAVKGWDEALAVYHFQKSIRKEGEVLGHASPATTLEIYVHSNNEEKKKALNKVFGAIKF